MKTLTAKWIDKPKPKSCINGIINPDYMHWYRANVTTKAQKSEYNKKYHASITKGTKDENTTSSTNTIRKDSI